VSADDRNRALQSFLAMHVEAMNWSGMGVREYAAALQLSSYALRRWRDQLEQIEEELARAFKGVLHVDGDAGFERLTATGDIVLAACWAHARRKFYEVGEATRSPLASEALRRIGELYLIEARMRGLSSAHRLAQRRRFSPHIVESLRKWLEAQSRRPSYAGSNADLPSRICKATAAESSQSCKPSVSKETDMSRPFFAWTQRRPPFQARGQASGLRSVPSNKSARRRILRPPLPVRATDSRVMSTPKALGFDGIESHSRRAGGICSCRAWFSSDPQATSERQRCPTDSQRVVPDRKKRGAQSRMIDPSNFSIKLAEPWLCGVLS